MADGYIRNIKNADAAIKRLNDQIKKIKENKKSAQQRLYKWMSSRGIDEYQGIKIKKITPKPKIVRKPKQDKKRDALELFSHIGVDDPETLWEEFLKTQK